MPHSITCKLNKDARQFQSDKGVTFFVDLGEKNYNFQKKENEYTNYSAALFAKDAQIGFYQSALVEGAVIEVSGTGIIIEMPNDPQYKPKLMIQDAKLGYVHSPQSAMQQQAPQQQYNNAPQQQQAPQMSPAYQQQAQQQQAPQQQYQQAPVPQHAPQQSASQQPQSWGNKPGK